MQLIDNLLPKGYARTIEAELASPSFPWNLNTNTVNLGSTLGWWDEHTQDSPQFTHVFAHEGAAASDYYALVQPMLYFLEQATAVEWVPLRIKANMLLVNPLFPDLAYHTQHTDVIKPLGTSHRAKSFLYYVNDSDGPTKFFDPDHQLTHIVEPKPNSGVLFDSLTWHASTSPKQSATRVVINFILEPRPY